MEGRVMNSSIGWHLVVCLAAACLASVAHAQSDDCPRLLDSIQQHQENVGRQCRPTPPFVPPEIAQLEKCVCLQDRAQLLGVQRAYAQTCIRNPDQEANLQQQHAGVCQELIQVCPTRYQLACR